MYVTTYIFPLQTDPPTHSTGVILSERFNNLSRRRLEELTNAAPAFPQHLFRGNIKLVSTLLVTCLIPLGVDHFFPFQPRFQKAIHRQLRMQELNPRCSSSSASEKRLTEVVFTNLPAERTREQLRDMCLAYGELVGEIKLDSARRVATVVFRSDLDAR